MRCDRWAVAREAALWDEWSRTVQGAGQGFWLPSLLGTGVGGPEVAEAVRAQARERGRAADGVARSLRSFAAEIGATDGDVARLFGTGGAWCVVHPGRAR